MSCGETNFGGNDVCCGDSDHKTRVQRCTDKLISDGCSKYWAQVGDDGVQAPGGKCVQCIDGSPDRGDMAGHCSQAGYSDCIQCNICHGTCCTDASCSNQPSDYDDACTGVTNEDTCNNLSNCTFGVPCYYDPDVSCNGCTPEYSCTGSPGQCKEIDNKDTCDDTRLTGECVLPAGSPCYSDYGIGQCKDPPQTDSQTYCEGYYGECSAGHCYSTSGVGQCKQDPQTESSTKCQDVSGCLWMLGTCSTTGDDCSTNSDCPACTWSPGTCKSNGNSTSDSTCTSDDDCQPCTWEVTGWTVN